MQMISFFSSPSPSKEHIWALWRRLTPANHLYMETVALQLHSPRMKRPTVSTLFMLCVNVWQRVGSFLRVHYLLLSRACASSNSFWRNRSRAAMQSSRASDKSEREHLKNHNRARRGRKRSKTCERWYSLRPRVFKILGKIMFKGENITVTIYQPSQCS